jgi:hypothetical protein
MEVRLEVDELDIADLSEGQEALIAMETWPDVEMTAVVKSIAPQGSSSPGSSPIFYEVLFDLGPSFGRLLLTICP